MRGDERPALIDSRGQLRDLSDVVDDIRADCLPALSCNQVELLPLIAHPVRYGVPVRGVGKFIAIGLNYAEHADETAMSVPAEPVVFSKFISCLGGPDDDVSMPLGATKMDWEVELGVVIGRQARYIAEEEALEHIAGYVLVNDLSERFDQLERGGSWDKGKGHDGFGPVGPWLVGRDELGNARGIQLRTWVNGELMQDGNTCDMIFGVAALVAYLSKFMTLEPGDIIATGTPDGVGLGKQPEPIFLKSGDIVELDGGPLGRQRQRIIGPIREADQ